LLGWWGGRCLLLLLLLLLLLQMVLLGDVSDEKRWESQKDDEHFLFTHNKADTTKEGTHMRTLTREPFERTGKSLQLRVPLDSSRPFFPQ
jgi:hypothetical protein